MVCLVGLEFEGPVWIKKDVLRTQQKYISELIKKNKRRASCSCLNILFCIPRIIILEDGTSYVGISVYHAEWLKDPVQIWALPFAGLAPSSKSLTTQRLLFFTDKIQLQIAQSVRVRWHNVCHELLKMLECL